MSQFHARNIDWRGRLVRGLAGLALLAGATAIRADWPWLAGTLGMAGLFCLFEAIRGWCVIRACGFNTRF